jgi:O-antigen ligase/tetratricopeptide (TPR) repeat protein
MSYIKALRWVLFIGLGAVFFVSLIIADGAAGGLIPNMFFPYITGKNFAFRLLVEILFALYIILALREPKYRPTSSNILWALGGFVVWIAIATIFSIDPVKSFWSNFERMEGYITLVHLFVYFVMLSAIVGAEKWWGRFLGIAAGATTLQAIYSMGQLLHVFGLAPSSQSGARLDGTFGNAAYLGVFMLFGVFVTLFLLVRYRYSILAQVLWGIALVLQVLTLFFTETRGAVLGVIGGLVITALFIAWRARGREWKMLRRVSLWGVGALVLISALFFALRSTPFVQHSTTLHRITSISLTDPTTISRFYIWDMAWHGFIDSPKTMAIGWGQENFSYVFNKYYLPQMYNQEQWFDRAHNQFLDWLVDGGLPAFVLYVSFFVMTVLAIVRSDLEVPEQAILLGLLAGYAFNNLFVFDDLMSSVWFFTLLALAHGISSTRLPRFLSLTKPSSDRAVAVVAPIVAVASILVIWMTNAPGIARAENLLTAIMTQVPVANAQGQIVGAPKDPKQNISDFQVALGQNAWPGTALGKQEATEQLLQFSSAQASRQNVDPAVKQDTYTLAEKAGIAINSERKHDARLELFMGAFYDAFGQYPKALQWLQQASADSPKKQQILFELGVDQINSSNIQDAVATLKTAFTEEPKDADARILYASALYYAGNVGDADTLLLNGPKDEGFGTVLINDTRLVQVYMRTKMYSRAIGILKNQIAAEPGNSQNYINLASAYFAMGDTANTIAAIEAAAKQDPSLAAQAQSLIQQIQNGTLKPGQ